MGLALVADRRRRPVSGPHDRRVGQGERAGQGPEYGRVVAAWQVGAADGTGEQQVPGEEGVEVIVATRGFRGTAEGDRARRMTGGMAYAEVEARQGDDLAVIERLD